MNIEYFKTFISLAETRNFSMTAEKMHVAQSTVSNRLKELEQHYGQPLFHRTNKSVELSEAGSKLLPQIMRIVKIESQAAESLRSIKYKNTIRIGSPHAAYRGLLKKSLVTLVNEDNDTAFDVMISHTNLLLEALYDGLVDMALVSYLPKNFGVKVVAEAKDRVILIRRKSKEATSEMTFEELKKVKMLHSDLGDGFDNWLSDQANMRFDYALYIDQINEVVDYVVAGNSYAFIPESIAEFYLNDGAIEKVNVTDMPDYMIRHYLIIKTPDRSGKDLSSYALKLISGRLK